MTPRSVMWSGIRPFVRGVLSGLLMSAVWILVVIGMATLIRTDFGRNLHHVPCPKAEADAA